MAFFNIWLVYIPQLDGNTRIYILIENIFIVLKGENLEVLLRFVITISLFIESMYFK